MRGRLLLIWLIFVGRSVTGRKLTADWAPLRIDTAQTGSTEPCSTFESLVSCQYENYCCFTHDGDCIPRNPDKVDCPLIRNGLLCRLYSNYCAWDGELCIRLPSSMDELRSACGDINDKNDTEVRRPLTSTAPTLKFGSPPSASLFQDSTSMPSSTVPTSSPLERPVLKHPTEPSIRRRLRRPKNLRISQVRMTRFPTRQPVPLLTALPHTASPTSLAWSSFGLSENDDEANATVPCNTFLDETSCQQRNFCCWDTDRTTCNTPTIDRSLECPLLVDEETCAIIYRGTCTWNEAKNRCQRRMPAITAELTADRYCEALFAARRKEESATPPSSYCFAKEVGKPCVFPIVLNGLTYSECVPIADYPVPLKSATGQTSWCPITKNFDLKSNKTGLANPSQWGFCTCVSSRNRPKSILMIIADDLRPTIRSAYGTVEASTPNLDELVARESTVIFDRAFTQYALCAPSRNLMFSGLSPDTTKQFNFAGTGLRSNITFRSRIRTLPEYFKELGFYTIGGGKVYHFGQDDPQSWSDPPYEPNEEQNGGCAQDPLARYITAGAGLSRVVVKLACQTSASENSLLDFRVAQRASETLQRIVHEGAEPFFLVAGFYKPHTPYHVQSKYWQNYPINRVPDVTRAQGPQLPSMYNLSLTFDTDSGVFDYWGVNPWEQKNGAVRKVMRAGYLAALSQTDAAIGKVLQKLKQLALEECTLIIMLGDNGYFLGENNLISKHTNFDLATRIPLILHIPWVKPPVSSLSTNSVTALRPGRRLRPAWVAPANKRIGEFFELLDLFPTLTSLMNKPRRNGLQGQDQSRLVLGKIRFGTSRGLSPPRFAAFSQVVRCVERNNCNYAGLASLYVVGYTVRTVDWRFTVFMSALQGRVANWSTPPLSQELYFHGNDDETLLNYDEQGPRLDQVEIDNLANDHPDICNQLFGLIRKRYEPLFTVS